MRRAGEQGRRENAGFRSPKLRACADSTDAARDRKPKTDLEVGAPDQSPEANHAQADGPVLMILERLLKGAEFFDRLRFCHEQDDPEVCPRTMSDWYVTACTAPSPQPSPRSSLAGRGSDPAAGSGGTAMMWPGWGPLRALPASTGLKGTTGQSLRSGRCAGAKS